MRELDNIGNRSLASHLLGNMPLDQKQHLWTFW